MTANESLILSTQIKDLLQTDLLHVFCDDVPIDLHVHQAAAKGYCRAKNT